MTAIASSIKKRCYFWALRAGAGMLTVAFLWGIWGSCTAAVADYNEQLNTPETLRKAVTLAPDNAAFRALLAEALEGSGEDPKPQLIEAMRLSPLDSQYAIRRAFRAEIEGDFAGTEALLLEAARLDHKANPRWALMNFYFRRGREADFWHWFNRTLSVSLGGAEAVYRLGWNMAQDSEVVLGHIPNTPRIMRQYLEYLAGNNRLDDAGAVAVRVASSGPGGQLPLLMAYCERYAEGDPGRAVLVWNTLARGKTIPYRPLSPESGEILTNEDFRIELASEQSRHRVFDWNLLPVEGISIDRLPEQKGIRFDLSGEEPETCDLMEQRIPLAEGKTYAIDWQAETPNDTPITGLFWQVTESGPEPHEVTAPIAGGAAGSFVFTAKSQSAMLRLKYARLPGTKRASGSITIRNLHGRLAR